MYLLYFMTVHFWLKRELRLLYSSRMKVFQCLLIGSLFSDPDHSPWSFWIQYILDLQNVPKSHIVGLQRLLQLCKYWWTRCNTRLLCYDCMTPKLSPKDWFRYIRYRQRIHRCIQFGVVLHWGKNQRGPTSPATTIVPKVFKIQL